jgi:hypothetical protein
MDAIALLENLGIEVEAVGLGKVKLNRFRRVRI